MPVLRRLFLSLSLLLGLGGAAHAVCPGSPLSNGTTADANQVRAWLNCKAPLDYPSFTGWVGIGTLSPISHLDIQSGSGVVLTLNDSSVPTSGMFQMGSSGGIFFLYQGRLGVSASAVLYADTNQIVTKGYMVKTVSGGVFTGAPLTSFPLSGSSYVNNGGNFGVGTAYPVQKLEVAGTIRQSACVSATLQADGNGDIICLSDARLKNVRGKFSRGIDALNRLSPQLFSYKADTRDAFVHAGFIAQNVKVAIPEAVVRQKDGYYGLDTTAIMAASVNAIKELSAMNGELRAEIQLLRRSQVQIAKELTALKAERNASRGRNSIRLVSQ